VDCPGVVDVEGPNANVTPSAAAVAADPFVVLIGPAAVVAPAAVGVVIGRKQPLCTTSPAALRATATAFASLEDTRQLGGMTTCADFARLVPIRIFTVAKSTAAGATASTRKSVSDLSVVLQRERVAHPQHMALRLHDRSHTDRQVSVVGIASQY
jgi:hypothetical protein